MQTYIPDSDVRESIEQRLDRIERNHNERKGALAELQRLMTLHRLTWPQVLDMVKREVCDDTTGNTAV